MITGERPDDEGGLEYTESSDAEREGSIDDNTGEIDLKALSERARSILRRGRSAVSDGLDRAQESVGPGIDRTKEALAPQIERAREVSLAGAERAQHAAERAFGAEFRREFERYVSAATTTIVGLHQDQEVLRARVEKLEGEVESLSERLSALEAREDD